EEPGRRRAGARPDGSRARRAGRTAHDVEGTPAGVQSRSAGGQGAALRGCGTLHNSLAVLALMLPALRFDTGRMAASADGLLLATDVADLLVEHGVPFRRAHEIVGGLVRHCLATGTTFRDLDDATLRRHAPLLDPSEIRGLSPGRSVARRRVVGGTAPAEVR